MEDNTNQVEPLQESTSQPRDEQGRFTPEVDPIVDEVIFGSKDPDELLNPTTERQTDTTEGTPVGMQADPSAQTSTSPDNDEVRYQYWQSEADKRGNELDGMKQTNDMLQKQVNTLIERDAAPGQGQPAQARLNFPIHQEDHKNPMDLTDQRPMRTQVQSQLGILILLKDGEMIWMNIIVFEESMTGSYWQLNVNLSPMTKIVKRKLICSRLNKMSS